MELSPGDFVLVKVQAPNPDFRKIADKWEQSPYKVISKFVKLLFRLQEVGIESNIHTWHRKMLFLLLTEDWCAQEEVLFPLFSLTPVTTLMDG